MRQFNSNLIIAALTRAPFTRTVETSCGDVLVMEATVAAITKRPNGSDLTSYLLRSLTLTRDQSQVIYKCGRGAQGTTFRCEFTVRCASPRAGDARRKLRARGLRANSGASDPAAHPVDHGAARCIRGPARA